MKIDKCLVDLGLVEGEAYEEAEPMAVLVIRKMPTDCSECGVGDSNGYCFYAEDDVDGVTDNWREGVRPDWCPLRKAIGIIEPNGHYESIEFTPDKIRALLEADLDKELKHINANDKTHIVGWEIEGENGLRNMPCEEEEK